MTIYQDRINDAAKEAMVLVDRLRIALQNQGATIAEAREAIEWAAIQLDPEADDYETWEATVLARFDDTDKTGER